MAKSKQQKQEVLQKINKQIKDSKSFIISVFEKLPVSEDHKLRSELTKEKIKHEVVKKTLLKKSFEENKLNELPENELIGNITITSSDDEIGGAKILNNFSKENEHFKILGGILNDIWVDATKISELAKLPSKQELIATTVGTIKAPITGFVNVMSNNLKNLVNVLNNIKSTKE